MNRLATLCLVYGFAMSVIGGSNSTEMKSNFSEYVLNYDTSVDPVLQANLERVDSELRSKCDIAPDQVAVGVLDLNSLRLAMIHPDAEQYGASVPKIGILLAYFQFHPEAATNLNAQTRHELGLMIKASDNEMAAKFSKQIGLKQIQAVLDSYHFYEASHGGGIWIGKHYGKGGERYGDPIADHSHAVTVRQLLRFFLMLEQGKLVSPAASKAMIEIFASPDIPHDPNKFVKGLSGRDVQLIRKSGSWEDWLHDSAVVTGDGRRYVLVALTKNPRGDEYLSALARAVDDFVRSGK